MVGPSYPLLGDSGTNACFRLVSSRLKQQLPRVLLLTNGLMSLPMEVACDHATSHSDLCSSQVVMAGEVPGLLQSAHRAELLAVLQSLRYANFWGQAIRIWSDCEAVVTRVRKILAFREPPKINSPHADLWNDVYAILQEWDFKKLQITKVAAHQDTFEPQGAFESIEQWAFAHNSLADRAARVANLQRSAELWDLHKKHAVATDYAAFVSGTVQDVILRISRRVVQRERLRDEMILDGSEAVPERPCSDEWSPSSVAGFQCQITFAHHQYREVWPQAGGYDHSVAHQVSTRIL